MLILMGCAAWRSSTAILKLPTATATDSSCGCTPWGCCSIQTPSSTCSPQVSLSQTCFLRRTRKRCKLCVFAVSQAKESSWSDRRSAILCSRRPCSERAISGRSVSITVLTSVWLRICAMLNLILAGFQVWSTTMTSETLASVSSCPPTSPSTSTCQLRRCRRSWNRVER